MQKYHVTHFLLATFNKVAKLCSQKCSLNPYNYERTITRMNSYNATRNYSDSDDTRKERTNMSIRLIARCRDPTNAARAVASHDERKRIRAEKSLKYVVWNWHKLASREKYRYFSQTALVFRSAPRKRSKGTRALTVAPYTQATA